jgi:nitrate/TMAO reductase-like tetraheme cytochrome c subunit
MRRSLVLEGVVFSGGCLALVLTTILSVADFSASAEEAAPKQKAKVKANYVGIKNCKLCHTDKKSGDQFGQWKASKHAGAFDALASAKAKEIATKQGIKDPQKEAKCLKCHVTGAEEPELSKKLKASDGVQCETCHGAGEFYAKDEVFKKGRDAAIAKGLVIPDEKLCVKCHNKESPTFTGFDFKEMWKKILHPNPLLKKGGK